MTLTINLTTVVGYWELSKGYIVATNSGLQYETDATLVIYNSNTGNISATALEEGIASFIRSGINGNCSSTDGSRFRY